MSPRHITAHGMTDVGCVRSGNEDCFVVQEIGKPPASLNPTGLIEIQSQGDLFAAVSDGMGGAAAGELASQTALNTITAYLDENIDALAGISPEQAVHLLEEGVQEANRSIWQKAQEVTGSRGMGATITAGYLKKDILYLFQIGDSRAYVLRDKRLYQITRDQSFVGHLVEMGTITEEQAMRHPQRNVILQALGSQDQLKVDVSYLPLCKDDLVLICSDGLHGEFLPVHFQRLVRNAAREQITDCVKTLIEEAKKAGGRDNITLVALKVMDGMPEREPGEEPHYMAFANLNEDNPLGRAQSIFR